MQVKIDSISKESNVETGERFLDVTFGLLSNGKRRLTRRLGFPLDTQEDDIINELENYASNYQAEREQAKEQEAIDDQDRNADSVIESLQGKTL